MKKNIEQSNNKRDSKNQWPIIYAIAAFYLLFLGINIIFNPFCTLTWIEAIIFTGFTGIICWLYKKITDRIIKFTLINKNKIVDHATIIVAIAIIEDSIFASSLILAITIIIAFSFAALIYKTGVISILAGLGIVLTGFIIILAGIITKSGQYQGGVTKLKAISIIIVMTLINPALYLSYIPVSSSIIDAKLSITKSMLPLIDTKNVLIINKIDGLISEPSINSIVLAKSPVANSPAESLFYTLGQPLTLNELYYPRRIIGKSGDSITVQPNGEVILNSNVIEEPYTESKKTNLICSIVNHCSVNKLNEGYYYLLGDNRPISQDSRIWSAIDKNHIKGTVIGIIKRDRTYNPIK